MNQPTASLMDFSCTFAEPTTMLEINRSNFYDVLLGAEKVNPRSERTYRAAGSLDLWPADIQRGRYSRKLTRFGAVD